MIVMIILRRKHTIVPILIIRLVTYYSNNVYIVRITSVIIVRVASSHNHDINITNNVSNNT